MTCRDVTRFDFKDWNATLGDALSESEFGKLPMDLITFIASHLSPQDLAHLDRTCRAFYIADTHVASRNLEVIQEAWSRLISLDQFPPLTLPSPLTREAAATVRTNLRGAVQRICSTKDFQPALAHHKGDLLAAAQELEDKDVIFLAGSLLDPGERCDLQDLLHASIPDRAAAARRWIADSMRSGENMTKAISLEGLEFLSAMEKIFREDAPRVQNPGFLPNALELIQQFRNNPEEIPAFKAQFLAAYQQQTATPRVISTENLIAQHIVKRGESMTSIPKEIALLADSHFVQNLTIFEGKIRVIPPKLLQEHPNLKKLEFVRNQEKITIPSAVQNFFQQNNRALIDVHPFRPIDLTTTRNTMVGVACVVIGFVAAFLSSRYYGL